MKPGTSVTAERPTGPAAKQNGGSGLSASAKRRFRREQYQARLVTVGVLEHREREIGEMKTQIIEHRRTVVSYVGGGKDSR